MTMRATVRTVLLMSGVTFLLGMLLANCGYEHEDEDYAQKLSVKLEWEHAVNVDLQVQEPTGEWVGLGQNGPTAVSTGDNLCGFGPQCDPDACAGLTCNTPEAVYANTVSAGKYAIRVRNDANPVYDPTEGTFVGEDVALIIAIPEKWAARGAPYYLEVYCYILNYTAPSLAVVEFSEHEQGSLSITALEDPWTQCTIAKQLIR